MNLYDEKSMMSSLSDIFVLGNYTCMMTGSGNSYTMAVTGYGDEPCRYLISFSLGWFNRIKSIKPIHISLESDKSPSWCVLRPSHKYKIQWKRIINSIYAANVYHLAL